MKYIKLPDVLPSLTLCNLSATMTSLKVVLVLALAVALLAPALEARPKCGDNVITNDADSSNNQKNGLARILNYNNDVTQVQQGPC